MSGYWLVIAPAGVAAMGAVVFLARWLRRHESPGRHAAHDPVPAVMAGIYERYGTVPVAEVAGQPPWEPAEHGPGSLGTWFPVQEARLHSALHLVDEYDPAEWSAADLAELHDAPAVLDDLESSGTLGQGAPEGGPGLPASGTEQATAGAGDESEASGPPAPPAPPRAPTRLLQTTGELLRSDLLADACAFMARQDAEVAVWLATARERWIAA